MVECGRMWVRGRGKGEGVGEEREGEVKGGKGDGSLEEEKGSKIPGRYRGRGREVENLIKDNSKG